MEQTIQEINQVLDLLSVKEHEVISVFEEGRGVIAVCKTVKTITKAISEEYCNVEATIVEAEYQKYDCSIKIIVQIVEGDGSENKLEFTLRTIVIYH